MRAETSLLVRDSQPFSDVDEFQCVEGFTNIQGNCEIVTTWRLRTPSPTFLSLFVANSDSSVARLFPSVVGEQFILTDAPPDGYEVQLLSVLSTTDGIYQGTTLVSNCTLGCFSGCNTPILIQVCQRAYSHPTVGNLVEVEWLETTSYDNVEMFLDGNPVEIIEGDR